eukprot:9873308-Prorocentrum_lima.AAC.1
MYRPKEHVDGWMNGECAEERRLQRSAKLRWSQGDKAWGVLPGISGVIPHARFARSSKRQSRNF